MKSNALSSAGAGFTLVEILVTVSIICILAALTLPMIGKMKESANGAHCSANLRTIGGAVQQYAADNQGGFPISRLQYQMDANGVKKTVPFLPDVLDAYLMLKEDGVDNINKLWWCPGDTERPVTMRKWSYGHNQFLGGNKGSRQTWNGDPNPEFDPRYATFQAVPKPLSQVIFLMDFVNTGDAGKWSSSITSGSWPMRNGSTKENPLPVRVDFERHGNYANALFLDGSVRALTFNDLVGTTDQYVSPERE